MIFRFAYLVVERLELHLLELKLRCIAADRVPWSRLELHLLELKRASTSFADSMNSNLELHLLELKQASFEVVIE